MPITVVLSIRGKVLAFQLEDPPYGRGLDSFHVAVEWEQDSMIRMFSAGQHQQEPYPTHLSPLYVRSTDPLPATYCRTEHSYNLPPGDRIIMVPHEPDRWTDFTPLSSIVEIQQDAPAPVPLVAQRARTSSGDSVSTQLSTATNATQSSNGDAPSSFASGASAGSAPTFPSPPVGFGAIPNGFARRSRPPALGHGRSYRPNWLASNTSTVPGPERIQFATPWACNPYCVPCWSDTARFVRSVTPLTARSSAPTDEAHASYVRVPSPSWSSSICEPQTSETGLAPLNAPSTMQVRPPMTERPRRLPWLDALVADVNRTPRDEFGYDQSSASQQWYSSSDDEESATVSQSRPPSIFTIPPSLPVATPPSGTNVRPICPDWWVRAHTHTCAMGDTSVRQYHQCDEQRIQESNARWPPAYPDTVVESAAQPRTPSSSTSPVVVVPPPPPTRPRLPLSDNMSRTLPLAS